MNLITLISILCSVLVIRAHPVHEDDDGVPAMEAILHQNEGSSDELAYIDVKIAPETVKFPEGVFAGIIKKNPRNLWDNNLVYYSFDNQNQFNSQRRSDVRAALDEIEEKTCIRFEEYPKGNAPGHYILIKSGSGCWSYIGKTEHQRTGYQDMSLSIPGCLSKKIIQHEFIHALGAFHEQARPDRDDYINLYPENMQNGAWDQFTKQEGKIDSLGVAYDEKSIMHYGSYTFSKNGQKTMVSKKNPNQPLGGSVLTDKDIQQLNLLYSCGVTPPTTTTTTTTTTTKKPTTTTTTTTTTTKKPKTTTKTPPQPDCKDLHDLCQFVPKRVCVDSRVKMYCPKRCGDCKKPVTTKPTTTTPMTTETMTTTPMTTTPMTTMTTQSGGNHCEDVSSKCRQPRCQYSIYRQRCRKACSLCNTKVPRQCQGFSDYNDSQCAREARNESSCKSPSFRRKCRMSCCLRGQ